MTQKALVNSIRDLRKELGRQSLKFFARTYFGHYCSHSFAPFHMDLLEYLPQITAQRGRQLAIAAPRGNAKSTIVSLIYVLWVICYAYERFIVLFSSTRKQSERLLAHIKGELSSNETLKGDFPEVCEPPNPRWRQDDIVTKNGVNVISSSVEHGIRGIRFKESRPGLIIADDVEAVETIHSQDQRDKVYHWFTKVVLNLGSEYTNYILVGTILHFDSLLARLLSEDEFPGWEKRIYKSVVNFSNRQDLWDRWGQIYRSKELYDDDSGPDAARKFFESNRQIMLRGTEVLWPEKESYLDLMIMREQKGNHSFDSEKQNEPRDTSGMSIDMSKVIFWEDKYQTLEQLETFLANRKVVLGACDPSIANNDRSNYSAIVTAYMDRKNRDLYVVDANLGRWDVNTLVRRICLHHSSRKYMRFAYESNAAQAWLGDIIKGQGTLIPLVAITSTTAQHSHISHGTQDFN